MPGSASPIDAEILHENNVIFTIEKGIFSPQSLPLRLKNPFFISTYRTLFVLKNQIEL